MERQVVAPTPSGRDESSLDDRPGILDAIGSTPLVRLDRLFAGSPVHVYAKLEAANPGGSIKDRAAARLVLDAVRDGLVVPGRTVIVESSSGNLGIGLAQVCRRLGIRLICVVDPRTTPQNIAILRAYGVEVDVVRTTDDAHGQYLGARLERVQHLCRTLPNAYWPNQYGNESNPVAQEELAREIVTQLPGELDCLIVATGTCGTLRGCHSYLRRHGHRTRIIAVDAEGSALFSDTRCSRLVPGHGAAIRPAHIAPDLPDGVAIMNDRDCVDGCRRLVRREGILSGGSSGAVVSAAVQLVPDLAPGSTCVLVFPDRGERYLDTIYDDAWVTAHFGSSAVAEEADGVAPINGAGTR